MGIESKEVGMGSKVSMGSRDVGMGSREVGMGVGR